MSYMFEESNLCHNLCRVCSSAGLHDIHSPIPFFLHNTNEFNLWPKKISVMMEEVTGLKISKEDQLPQKICTICISYLKHAVNFRQQVLANNQRLLNKPINRSNNASPFIKSYPINETNVNKETFENLKAELDLFFNDYNDLDTDDSDDEQSNENNTFNQNALTKSDITKTAVHSFFNYSEKTFEEDDLSDFHRISINQPDDYKERKCYACKRRFMLHDTYEQHMKDCIQGKLISFINDCDQLLIIKKHKAISASEFMRRMIFALKIVVKSLAMSYRVISNKQLIRDTNPDVIKTENTWTKKLLHLDEQLFKSSENILRINQKPLLEPLKIIPKPLSPLTANFLPKTMNKSTPKTSTNFVAKCTACNVHFNAIDELEMHNRNMHNTSGGRNSVSSNFSSECGDRLMSSLMDSDSQDGIVDVFKLRQRSPNVVNIELNTIHDLM